MDEYRNAGILKKWYEKAGEEPKVIVSTRVRLGRNLRGFPFPARASLAQKEQIIRKVRDALLDGNSVLSKEFKLLDIAELTARRGLALTERHIVSPEFVNSRSGNAVLVSEDESVSIMINEEDHVRIQVLRAGQALKSAAETADRIDTLLSEGLDFAYDPELGYLTQCPTNLGTGMRASLMMHLPALTEEGSMPRMAQSLGKLGLAIRGAYGEGSVAVGDMYQLSNQITLGLSENQAVENLRALAGQLVSEELRLRERLLENVQAQDKIARAAGTLRSAKLMAGGEAAQLLSLVRLGVAGGLLEGIELGQVNGLMVRSQPGSIMETAGKELGESERDKVRADMLREACKGIMVK